MGKGYAEGSAAEEAEAARERGDHLARPAAGVVRRLVLGSTKDDPSQHVLGYADEIDPDKLFASGEAWGLKVVTAVE
ncbi:MAG: hypothetical protein QOG02_1657 [Gaiellales bacterium]|jgi:hypothetical protein|nr:hypothetical protein [Gaiellales bacterium]MDX6545883.1 hypothetical protein [Gaiellales bacterium]